LAKSDKSLINITNDNKLMLESSKLL
jgi:hypothetical protein